MQKKPVISIIVPVYKVEKYLPACIDSILAQTFRDFELILVDDGSPDGCPALCDAAAERDERVRVIHQKNGGLSAARNAGLDIARGEWIGFVDSDDLIEVDMYEALYCVAQEHHADLAFCALLTVDEENRPIGTICEWTKLEVLNRNQAIARIASTTLHVAWNKLYRRRIFETLRFPVGRLNEDSFVAPAVLEQVRTAVYVPQQYYHYRQHDSSIMNKRQTLRNYDGVEAAYGCWQCQLRHGQTKALPKGAQFVLGSLRKVYSGLSPAERHSARSREMKKLQRDTAVRTWQAGAHSVPLLLRTLLFQLWPEGYCRAHELKEKRS